MYLPDRGVPAAFEAEVGVEGVALEDIGVVTGLVEGDLGAGAGEEGVEGRDVIFFTLPDAGEL